MKEILITRQINDELKGKTIRDIIIELDVIPGGSYPPNTLDFSNTDKLIEHKIIKADAGHIFAESDYFAEFCYQYDNCIGYFKNGEKITVVRKNEPKGGAFSVKFIFDDGCLVILLNQWSCGFSIKHINTLGKAPIDVFDDNDFTIEKFEHWLASHQKTNIIEACVLKEGAFNINTGIMMYVLWQSSVHPKTKVIFLSDDDIKTIYYNTKKMISEYKNGKRRVAQYDLYGNYYDSKNYDSLDAKWFAKPCPLCETNIDISTARGTKVYFCPNCQVLKR
jgi:formamidopyrimidine-DNA glycosylase